MLLEGVDIDIVDNKGRTALMFAIYTGHTKIAKLLIGAGINSSINGITELMIAAYIGDIGHVKRLIEIDNADLEAYDSHRRTAVMFGTLGGNIEVVEFLVKNGADINASTENGRTALMFAAMYKIPKIVEFFVRSGADLNFTDRCGNSALMIATYQSSVEIVTILVNNNANLDLIEKEGGGYTAAMMAAFKGNIKIVKLLVEAGAVIGIINPDWYTEHDFAISENHTEIAAYLRQYFINYHHNTFGKFILNLFSTDSETINMEKYGIYKGGAGHDTFIVNSEYEGQQDGYKLAILDFNYLDQRDYIDLSQFTTIKSIDDISFEQISFNGKNSLELKTKPDGQTIVVLINQTKESLISENFLIGAHVEKEEL